MLAVSLSAPPPLLTTSTQESIASRACGVLNYAGDKCLNKPVEDAVVEIMDAGTDFDTIATVFKNALDFNYKDKLLQLIKNRCKKASPDYYTNNSELALSLLSKGIILLKDEDGELAIVAAPFPGFVHTDSATVTAEGLGELEVPLVLAELVSHYSAAPKIDFDEENFSKNVDAFMGGDPSFKGEFIKQAIAKGQKEYLGRVFARIRIRSMDVHQPNLSSVDLSGLDLSGLDLRNANLKLANLEKTKFNGANLSCAILEGTHLSGDQLDDVILRDTRFSRANLTGIFKCDLSKSSLDGVILKNADISKAKLGMGTSFRFAQFENVVFPQAIVEFDFFNATFDKVDLSDKGLHKIVFNYAKLRDVNMSNRRLSGSNFWGATFKKVNVKNADLSGLNFSLTGMTEVNLEDALSVADMTVGSQTVLGLSDTTKIYLNSKQVRKV